MAGAQPPYNWEILPDFTLAKGRGITTSLISSISNGYDINATRINQKRRELALSRANGILSGLDPPHTSRVRFFASQFETSIGLGGSYGQGRRVRDFYPHNLNMTMYKITGQCLNQEDFGLLCEFIHASHQNALSNGRAIQLNLLEGGLLKGPRTMKGIHKPITAEGFIGSIPREHKQFVYVPTFTIEFAVVRSYEGIFRGSTFLENPQRTFLQILQNQEKPFSQAPKETGKNTKATTTPVVQPAPVSNPPQTLEGLLHG